MAFVVEDGIGRVDANSYSTVAFARDYALTRGRADFTGEDDSQVEIWLIRGSEYIDQRWGDEFQGQRKARLQGLLWPRIYAYDEDGILIAGIPRQLCAASVEMAMRATEVARLLPDPPSPFPTKTEDGTITNTGTGEIRSQLRQVGPIRTQTVFAESGAQSGRRITSTVVSGVSQPEYPQVRQILLPLLGGAGGDQIIRN